MDIQELSPPELMQRLLSNGDQIQKIGNEKSKARLEMIIAERELANKESSIYTELCEAIRPTRLEMEIKHRAIRERETLFNKRAKFYELQDAWDTVVEVNNALKAYIRLKETEMHNL